MKKHLLAGITAIALVAGGAAFAQSVSIEIAPEQRTTIKEYVVKEKVSPVTVKEKVAVGVILPETVTLQTVPETWGNDLTKYRYVYVEDRVVLVEPDTRRVVHIIE